MTQACAWLDAIPPEAGRTLTEADASRSRANGSLDGVARCTRAARMRGLAAMVRASSPFLGAPVGGIEHLRCGAEAGQRIEQFVARRAKRRQPVAGKAHPQGVALAFRHMDRIAAHLVGDTARLQAR